MQRVNELIMIIPVIQNLKGNLEMNMSARLSTAANTGELDKAQSRRAIILGNLSLLQVQAALVSFVAAIVSVLLGLVVPRVMPYRDPAVAAAHNATMAAHNATMAAHNATMSAHDALKAAHDAALAAAHSEIERRRNRPQLPAFNQPIRGISE